VTSQTEFPNSVEFKTIKKLIKIFVATEFFIGIDKPYQSIGGISIFKIN
jgi:hypothetical protein